MNQDFLPPHLRDDAPCQQCDRCLRKTWDTAEFGGTCTMPQRVDGLGKWVDPCGGTFRKPLGGVS